MSAAPIPSLLAEAAHAAYLGRVAALVDGCAPGEEADLLIRTGHLSLHQATYLVDRLGVPPMALMADADGAGWPLLTASVEFLGGRARRFGWRPGDGTAALATVARDAEGFGTDVVAFSLRDDQSGSLDGIAMIGAQDLADDPVAVHTGALAWLRAGRRGVVVLDRGRGAAALRACREIVVESRVFGLALERAITPRLPAIGVREPA